MRKPPVTKRGLYAPDALYDAWKDACIGNVTDGFIGAIVVWMALPADIREQAMQVGRSEDPAKAVRKVRAALVDRMANVAIEEYVRGLAKAEKVKLLKKAVRK